MQYLYIGTKDKYQKVADKAMHDYSIEISARSVRKQIYEWQQNQTVREKQRDNVNKRFISDKGLLAINKALHVNPCLTSKKLSANSTVNSVNTSFPLIVDI